MINRRLSLAIALLSAVVVLAEAAPAPAFDRGPHTELTEAAMTDEGFGSGAAGVAEVNNWFVDLYHELSVENLPFSGFADPFKRLVVGVVRTEGWSQELVSASTRMHFDNNPGKPATSLMPSLKDTAGIKAEWDRLQRATWTLVREARDKKDVEMFLTVLGASLHPVQDFYSHTNWMEPHGGPLGTDGPGWKERGYGSCPTWFDVPAEVREQAMVYGDSTPGHSRIHGLWSADGNTSLTSGMNKDWEGRPLHVQAVMCAYFASRQWIEAVRSWVDDPVFWEEAQHYIADKEALEHDEKGMFNIMLYTGHWHGQGEPFLGLEHGAGGSLLDGRQAVKDYFQPSSKLELIGIAVNPFNGFLIGNGPMRGRTKYRARFERLIQRLADPKPTGEVGPVPSSQDMQRSKKFVVLRVMRMESHGLGDPGPDDADMYARVRIDGQRMASAVFHGHDTTNFPNPFEPFTWVKAVPATADRGEPVESIEVEVKTGDVRWAGTDDDVYLRLSGNVRFPLDKRLYNDFERDDRDRYSVPIDDAVMAGMEVGDITRVEIEKDSDGVLGGGWKLGGVKLTVNGRVVYNNQGIDRWLQDDDRDWRAPDYQRFDPRGKKVPVVIRLAEDDFIYGGDDEGDINPYDRRDYLSLGYTPGGPLEATTRGGNLLMGRWQYGGDEAEITYRLETITPEPMRQTGPPTPTHAPGPPVRRPSGPDLVISAFRHDSVTVTNQGGEPAGPFRLRASGDEELEEVLSFQGLAPGASVTRPFLVFPCTGTYRAIVDDLDQVAEADEGNNGRIAAPVFC